MAIGVPTNILAASGTTFSSGSPCTQTTSTLVPIGTLVLAAVDCAVANQTLSTLVDSVGNTYQIVHSGTNASVPDVTLVWSILKIALSVGSTLTGTTSGGGAWYVTGGAWSVTGCAGGLDLSFGGVTGSVSSISQATGKLTWGNELLFSFITTISNTSAESASGFTALTTTPNTTFAYAAYAIVTSPASVTWNPTWTTASLSGWVLATFKAYDLIPPKKIIRATKGFNK